MLEVAPSSSNWKDEVKGNFLESGITVNDRVNCVRESYETLKIADEYRNFGVGN